MSALSPKYQRFIAEYLIDLNATQAAIRAGYSVKTARAQGCRLLTKADIVAAIEAAHAERLKRTQVDSDWLLERLAVEARADLADIYDAKGALKPVSEWPLIWRQGLVAGVETVQEFEEVDGKKVPIGLVHKIKISDRIRRLELIGKHVAVGAFAERHEITGKDGGPIETKSLTDSDLAREVAFLLTQSVQETKTVQ